MDVPIALAIFVVSYVLITLFTYLSRQKLSFFEHHSFDIGSTSHKFAYLFILTIFVALPLVLLFNGTQYVLSVINSSTYFSNIYILFLCLTVTSLLWFYKMPAWFIRVIKNKWRDKILPVSAISSLSSILKWFFILILFFALSAGLNYIIKGKQPLVSSIELLVPEILKSVFFAPIIEETFFRWIFYLFIKEIGLTIGTIFWFLWHPLQLWLINTEPWIIVINSIFIWLPAGYVYVRVWKGKYFWTTYIMHTVYNFIVIFSQGMLGFPA